MTRPQYILKNSYNDKPLSLALWFVVVTISISVATNTHLSTAKPLAALSRRVDSVRVWGVRGGRGDTLVIP